MQKRNAGPCISGSHLPLDKSAMISEIPLLYNTALQSFTFVSSFNFFVNIIRC